MTFNPVFQISAWCFGKVIFITVNRSPRVKTERALRLNPFMHLGHVKKELPIAMNMVISKSVCSEINVLCASFVLYFPLVFTG